MAALGWIAAALLGWLAGGLANWAADALPHLSKPATPEAHDAPGAEQVRRSGGQGIPNLFGLSHYLTLPWYPFRRGLCPHCGERRPLRAPLLELGMIAAFLAGWVRFRGTPATLITFWFYAAFLLVVLVIDLEHRLVLNVMLLPGAVGALVLSFLPGNPDPLRALLGGAIGSGLFFVIALVGRGAMGMGDVKLAGVIGLMAGYPAVLPALLLGVILGGLGALILIFMKRAGRKSYIAYAPYLCIGALVTLWRVLH
jgi:prepilin signal peptidase PulO-like enzyme (type II secretory pathway)